jgi:hypothetical protein
MTGKITVGTIQDTNAKTVASIYVTNGTAKAWVYFDTGDNPPNPDASFLVSSLTDDASEIEVNLTNVMSSLYYIPVAGGGASTSARNNPSNRSLQVITRTTSIIDTEIYTTDNAHNTGQCHIAVFGDLA